MSTLFRLPKAVAVQSDGSPYPSAKAYFYLTGTTTLTDVYQDSDLVTPHANPVVADSSGVFAPIYLDPDVTYKLTLKTSLDSLIYSVDPINDELSAANLGAILYPRTAAEVAAGVTPTSYSYPAGDVRRYGAVGDGVTDDTTAFYSAIASVTGEIVFDPSKTYAVNLVITKRGTRINGRGGDNLAVGGTIIKNLIPYDPTQPVIQIGNDTAYVGGVTIENLSIWSQSPSGTHGQIGLLLAGGCYGNTIRNVQIGNQFSVHNLKLISGSTYANAYNQIVGLQLWTLGNTNQTATLGSYYGNTYCTANFISHFNITGPSGTGTGYAIENDSCRLDLVNGWVQCSNGKGLHISKNYGASSSPYYEGYNVIVDSDSSTDVLFSSAIASDTNVLPINFLKGSLSIDGKYQNQSGTQTSISNYQDWVPYLSILTYPIYYGYQQQYNITTNATVKVASTNGSNNDVTFGDSTVVGYAMLTSGTNGCYLAVSGTSIVLAGSSYFRPNTDNTINLGGASNRWKEIFAGNATINTSDGREKQQIRSLTDAEHAVAVSIKGLLRAFKFNDSVTEKGDSARIHFGVIAQDVKAAFEAQGLVAEKYGLFCYDEWTEESELLDENGKVVRSYRPAGNRYGIRYDELLAFMIAAL